MERPAELSAKKARRIKNIVMKLLFFLNEVMRLSRSAAERPRGGTAASPVLWISYVRTNPSMVSKQETCDYHTPNCAIINM